ncbi:MAG: OmpH family outer membrane protein, partial [Pseudohongiellaceae bacterium]
AMQQRLQQDNAVMSDAEKRRVSDQIEEIGVQYQFLEQKLQETVQQRRQQFQQAYAPNLIQAIQAVVEEEGFDLVLRAEAALHYRSAYDITAKVTEKLNQQQ